MPFPVGGQRRPPLSYDVALLSAIGERRCDPVTYARASPLPPRWPGDEGSCLCLLVQPEPHVLPRLATQMLDVLQSAYLQRHARSTTSGLGSAIDELHRYLQRENDLSLPQHRSYAAASLAVVRPGSAYVAVAGEGWALALSDGRVQRFTRPPDEPGQIETPLGHTFDPSPSLGHLALSPGATFVLAQGYDRPTLSDEELGAAMAADTVEEIALSLHHACAGNTPDRLQSLLVVRVPDVALERELQASPADHSRNGGAHKSATVDGTEPHPALPSRPKIDEGPALHLPRAPSIPVVLLARRLGRGPRLAARQMERLAALLGVAPGLLAAGVALAGVLLAFLLVAGLTLLSGSVFDGHTLLLVQAERRLAAATQADATTARQLVVEALDLARQALAHRDSPRGQALLAQAREQLDRLDGVVDVAPEPLLDLATLPADAAIAEIALVDDTVFLLDLGAHRVYRWQLGSPDSPQPLFQQGDRLGDRPIGAPVALASVPSGPLRSEASLAALEAGRSLLLHYRPGRTDRVQLAGADAWVQVQALAAQANGLYVLDRGREALYYYPATQNGYEGQPFVVLDSREGLSLGRAVDVAAGGDRVFLLTEDGRLFASERQGGVTRLATEPPDRPLHGPTAIAADQQGNLFVADAGNARVVEFGPDGSFRRQFRLPSDGGAGGLRSVEVDSLGERLYLLTTTGLFAAPLSS